MRDRGKQDLHEGVVFSLLTWFFLIGAIVVLGALLGAVWQAHVEHDPGAPKPP